MGNRAALNGYNKIVKTGKIVSIFSSMPRKIDPNLPVFSIGSVADILGIQPRMLRLYEEKGLVLPSRSGTNRRIYSLNDIDILAYIQYLTTVKKVNLAGVLEIQRLLLKMNEKDRNEFISEIESEIESLSTEKKHMFESGEDGVVEEILKTSEENETIREDLKKIKENRSADKA